MTPAAPTADLLSFLLLPMLLLLPRGHRLRLVQAACSKICALSPLLFPDVIYEQLEGQNSIASIPPTSPLVRFSFFPLHLVLVVVPALAQGQARAADVHHVVQVVRDLVDLAVVVAVVACHTTRLSTLVFKCVSCFVLFLPERI